MDSLSLCDWKFLQLKYNLPKRSIGFLATKKIVEFCFNSFIWEVDFTDYLQNETVTKGLSVLQLGNIFKLYCFLKHSSKEE